MYISRIFFNIKDDQVQTFQEVALKVSSAARIMTGCQSFVFLRDEDDKNRFMLYEEWNSSKNADAFKKSNIRLESIQKLAPTLANTPDILEFNT